MGRKLIDIDTLEARVNFDRASNVMFLPPEYATINCINPCIFTGVTLTGNGLAGTLSVGGGTPVFLVASKQSGTTCNVFYDWTLNGAYMPWSSTGKQVYTFDNAGSYLVRALGECSPCDLTRIGQLTVNVSGNCVRGAAYDFHAPRIRFRAVAYPITIGRTATNRIDITVTLRVTGFPNDFSDIKAWIQQIWDRTVSLCGVSYTFDVTFLYDEFGLNNPHMRFKKVNSLPPQPGSTGHSLCGQWDPTQTPTLLTVDNLLTCNQQTTAGHEFGHELGFENAYDENTLAPLHSQTDDVMTSDGTSIWGAHARVLVEQYGE